MNSGQRTAVSLLVTVVLFAGFLMLCLPSPGLGLLDKLESKFYSEKRIEECSEKLKAVEDSAETIIYNDLFSSFENLSQDASVLSFFEENPSAEKQIARENAKGKLSEKLSFDMRVIDADGRKVHHSTFDSDKIKQGGGKTTYKVWRDIAKDETELPLEKLLSGTNQVLVNKTKNQLIYSYGISEKGQIVFYVNPSEIRSLMEDEKVLAIGESLSMVVLPDGTKGFVTGIPKSGASILEKAVIEKWQKKSDGKEAVLEEIVSSDDKSWSLVTVGEKSAHGLIISGVYDSSLFDLPSEIEYLLYVCFCITFFLIVFLVLSARHDDLVVIRSRVKKLQNAFITEYLENKENVDWAKVLVQIESRRGDFYEDVKRSLGRKGKKHAAELDACFERSWNEIVSVIGKNERTALGTDIEEFKKILEQVIAGGKLQIETVAPAIKETAVPVAPTVPKRDLPAAPVVPGGPVPKDEYENIDEELAEVEEAEAVEELDDVEEIEEVEEVEPAEELDDVEEIEEIEEAETVEELDEVEEIEEVEEAESVEELDDVEEIEEVEPAEPAEELDEIDEIEPVEPAEELDIIDKIEPTEPAEPVEPTESTEPTKPVEPIEELDDVEEIPETELFVTEKVFTVVDDIDPLEDDTDDVEELNDIEEVSELFEEVDSPESKFGPADDEILEFATKLSEPSPRESEVEPEFSPKSELIEEISDSSVDFKTFHKSDDNFATVDDIFAEELTFGESYTATSKNVADYSASFNFELEDPGFGEDEELVPLEEPEKHSHHFAMTGFGANNNFVTELESEEPEPFVENDGVYSISENFEIPKTPLNADFKKLVDSVL